MSAINKALSEISEKTSPSELTRADIPKVSRNKPWVWLIAGFSLSLAVGGWAVSRGPVPASEIVAYQSNTIRQVESTASESASSSPTSYSPTSYSPTNKVTPETNHQVFTKPVETRAVDEPVTAKAPISKVATPKVAKVALKKQPQVVAEKPILVAQVATGAKTRLHRAENSEMNIEQVELTHSQLATKALGRAEKAMDSNDMQTALSAYSEALRYEPANADTRQKLAALYFGKGDTRKAYEIIQEGISLDTNNQVLRLALAKLLVKANQPEAALSPLVHLPPVPSSDYLAMRAALAQKQKQNEIALESYRLLIERNPENARWWLGLAIQQERTLQYSEAINSYNNALGKVGISNQSQAFIRDRLTILMQLENAQ